MITKNDLAEIGAKVELVNLKRRRLEILKMFPALDDEEEPVKSIPDMIEPPIGASGRRLQRGGLTYKVWEHMKKNPGIVKAPDVASAINAKTPAVAGALGSLVEQKIAAKVGRGSFKLR